MRKFVRRHRALTVGAGVVFGVLVLGICTTAREAIRANAQADRANAQAREAQARYAQSLVSPGDALMAADHPDRAKLVFVQAEKLLRAQGLPASPAQYGLWNAFRLEAEPVSALVGRGQSISDIAFAPDGLECVRGG